MQQRRYRGAVEAFEAALRARPDFLQAHYNVAMCYEFYLHDTPNDNLFKEDVRAFSHGCIRLEKPDEMARWVLGWDIERPWLHSSGETG